MPPKIQHLRSTTANKRPDPALLADGQMAQNTAAVSPGAFIKLADGKVAKIGPTHVGTTAPNATPAAGGSAGNSVGEGWLDTSLNPPALKVWNGTAWVAAFTPAAVPAASETVAGIAQVATQAEVDAGTINNEMVTPLKLRAAVLGPLAKHNNVSDVPATDGQALMWDGTQWAPTDIPDPEETVVVQTTNLDLYVATTGNDTTGDGTQALPWATPHQAMAFLSKCVLADGVEATVHVADGDYTFTRTLNLNHPQGTQVSINGSSTSGTRPFWPQLNGGGTRGNTPETRSFNESLLDAYYNTTWLFVNCIGLTCRCGGAVTINKVLIKGDGSEFPGVVTGDFALAAQGGGTTADGSDGVGSGAIELGEEIAVHGFGRTGILALRGGVIACDGATITNCSVGASAIDGAYVACNDSTITNHEGSGVYAFNSASMSANNGLMALNGLFGVHCRQAAVEAIGALCTDNAFDGFRAEMNGSIRCTDSQAIGNGRSGYQTRIGGSINADNSKAEGNERYGVVAYDVGATILVNGFTSRDNTLGPYYAAQGGSIAATGAQDYTGTPTPLFNTLGNGNSYISTRTDTRPMEGVMLSWQGKSFYGTVSNSGNGAIMQQGTNANGRWVRYADGTQHAFMYGFETRTASGRNDTRLTLPATFVNASVSSSASGSSSVYSAVAVIHSSVPETATSISVDAATTTSLEVRIVRSNSTNTAFNVIVIGRWY